MNPSDLDLALLDHLTQAPGLPGREERVAAVIQNNLPKTTWSQHTDRLGNVIAHLPGSGPKVILMAHMDEVGLLVRRITDDGYLLIERIGGMGVNALPGSRLTLWTQNGPLPAQVGILPQHMNHQGVPDLSDMYVDIGASSRKTALDLGVRPGDGLTWASTLQPIGTNRVSAKALDDRLGCLALIELARRLKPAVLACDLWMAFIVQEETALSGGLPVVQAVRPDVVIGVDGTLTFDTPDLEGAQSDIRLGNGPALKWMDTIRGKQVSYVPHPDQVRAVQAAAARLQITLQDEITVGISTALAPIPYAADGIATLALSIPIRYHHTPIETADLGDVCQMITLLQALATRPESAGPSPMR